jgi:hypothetical protein
MRTANSALDTPRLTSSDLRSRLTLSFQLTIIDKFAFAILETNYHICKLFGKNKNELATAVTVAQPPKNCASIKFGTKFQAEFHQVARARDNSRLDFHQFCHVKSWLKNDFKALLGPFSRLIGSVQKRV